VKIFVKRLGSISNPLRSANCLCGWESVGTAMEYLFIGGDDLIDRLNNGQATEINYDFGSTSNWLLIAIPHLIKQSGRYRLINAIPI